MWCRRGANHCMRHMHRSRTAARAAMSAAMRSGPGRSVSHSEVAYTQSSSSSACWHVAAPARSRARPRWAWQTRCRPAAPTRRAAPATGRCAAVGARHPPAAPSATCYVWGPGRTRRDVFGRRPEAHRQSTTPCSTKVRPKRAARTTYAGNAPVPVLIFDVPGARRGARRRARRRRGNCQS